LDNYLNFISSQKIINRIKNFFLLLFLNLKFRRKKEQMSYYTNTQGLYYNSQFDLDIVKQEIFTIRNLQNTLTQDLTKIRSNI
jgi:hypothetical protein